MDIEQFMRRAGILSKTDLAKMLDTSPQNINRWFNKERKEPTYDMCKRLLKIGMTVEELFGKDVAEKVLISCSVSGFKDQQAQYSASLDMNNPAVKSALEQAFKDMLLNTAKSIGDKR